MLDAALTNKPTWTVFAQKLHNWRTSQRKRMPALKTWLPPADDCVPSDEDDTEDDAVTEEVLGLPSDFSRNERNDYELDELASFELSIRIGLAFDQLEAVRRAVQHRAVYVESKRKNVRGTKNNAAAEEDVRRAAAFARLLAMRYNHNFQRVTDLRSPEYSAAADTTAGARLRKIDLDHDLSIPNLAAMRTEGDTGRTGSWIWAAFDDAQLAHATRAKQKPGDDERSEGEPPR